MNNNQATTIAAAAVACTTLTAATLVSVLAPGGDITPILSAGGTMIVAVVTLGRTGQIKGTVDDLANGKMDAKIRANVADVLKDHLIDPTAREQIAQDRVRRDDHSSH